MLPFCSGPLSCISDQVDPDLQCLHSGVGEPGNKTVIVHGTAVIASYQPTWSGNETVFVHATTMLASYPAHMVWE